MSYLDKGIMPRQTAQELERNFALACDQIHKGYDLLYKAEQLLEATFGKYTRYGDLGVFKADSNSKGKTHVERVINKLKKSVWYKLIGLLEIDKLASKERYDKIQKSLEEGNLPDVTFQEIYALFDSFIQNQDEITKELMQEAFSILFPRHEGYYKTNKKHNKGTGNKVILPWKVEHTWGGEFRVSYHREQELVVIDRVFHLLDGKGIPEGYRCPLVDTINTSGSTGRGETEYFKFRACQNRNLHLEFKRMDLLNTLVGVAGGGDKLAA